MMPVHWYGERGILNTLVVALAARPDEAQQWARVLQQVVWADGGKPSWVTAVTDVNVVVELGCSNFGNPDLVVVANCEGAGRHVVFIEAKVEPYATKATKNTSIAAQKKGFSSTINGQLSLRYRLAAAIRDWDGERPDIVESKELHAAYVQSLGDPWRSPRHVKNKTSLELLRVAGAGDVQELDRFWFVALMPDKLPFFQDPTVAEDQFPLLLDPRSNRTWDGARSHLGWLNYDRIREAAKPGDAFEAAVRTVQHLFVAMPSSGVREDNEQ
jgi:hypothetical protein